MLGPADDVERGVEASTALGADNSRVSAGAVFFQHFEQCGVLGDGEYIGWVVQNARGVPLFAV